jgi:hypothetical protein
MSNLVPLNRHQKKALVIELYNQGKTRRQIAEIVHMSFKDIADTINEYVGEDIRVNKPEKSKDAQAFELFLQGKQSVEVAIELDMPADQVEELHVQYWRLSKLDNLEISYHETEYSLSLLLRLHNILKDKRITKDKDISDLIELANDGIPNLKARFEVLLNQITALENERASLSKENLGAGQYIDNRSQNAVEELNKLGGAKVILATVQNGKAMTEILGGLAVNGQLVVIGAFEEPIQVPTNLMIIGRRSLIGWPAGTSINSQDTLSFSCSI